MKSNLLNLYLDVFVQFSFFLLQANDFHHVLLFQKVFKPKEMGGYVTTFILFRSFLNENFNLEPRIFPLQAVLLVKKEKMF